VSSAFRQQFRQQFSKLERKLVVRVKAKFVTLKLLDKLGACVEGKREFLKTFQGPDGREPRVLISVKNLQRFLDNRVNTFFSADKCCLAYWLLSTLGYLPRRGRLNSVGCGDFTEIDCINCPKKIAEMLTESLNCENCREDLLKVVRLEETHGKKKG
jgi:hypothetical protein